MKAIFAGLLLASILTAADVAPAPLTDAQRVQVLQLQNTALQDALAERDIRRSLEQKDKDLDTAIKAFQKQVKDLEDAHPGYQLDNRFQWVKRK